MALKSTPALRAKVLEAFRKTGRIDRATAAYGLDRSTFYHWLKRFPDFSEAFEACRPEVAALIEDQLHVLAFEGVEEPVFHAGKRAMDVARDAKGAVVFKPCSACKGKGDKCESCKGTGRSSEALEVPASIRRVFPNVALAIAAARIPAYQPSGISKTRVVDEKGNDRDIQVTVEYTDKSIPE